MHNFHTQPKANLAVSLVIALSALLFTATTFATEIVEEPVYVVLGDRMTGTRIRPEIVISELPLNATYEQLSADDKAKIRANYDNMPEGDEPPFPKEGLFPLWEHISGLAYKRIQKGNIMAIASVDATGKVGQVMMYETTSNTVTRVVSTVLAATEFKPAVCSGKPCAMDFIFEGRLDIDLLDN